MLSSQSREFHKFFAPLIVGAMILPDFFLRKPPKNMKLHEKVCDMRTKIFAFFALPCLSIIVNKKHICKFLSKEQV